MSRRRLRKNRQFPPGHYLSSKDGGNTVSYFKPAWRLAETIPTSPVDLTILPESLVQCIQSQMMSEVPFGVLLSGGLDRSLIAAIAKKLTPPSKKLLSFCVGFEGSTDMKYAAFTEEQISDSRFKNAKAIFPYDAPTTKEAFYYRDIFDMLFPSTACLSTVKRWVPRLDWGCNEDPSGRAQRVHVEAYSEQ